MKPLRIALTKGRLEKTTIELLEKIGYNCDEVKNKGRRLILPIGNNDFEKSPLEKDKLFVRTRTK